MIWPEFHPQHLGVHRRVRGFPPHPAPLRSVAEDLQYQAEGGWRPTSEMRQSHGGKNAQRYMARGLLHGDHKGVAIGVVLHHRAARHQLGGSP